MATAEASKQRKSKGSMNGSKLGPQRWEEWTAHLAHRESPAAPADLLPTQQGIALAWALPDAVKASGTEELVTRLNKLKPRSRAAANWVTTEVESWLEALDTRAATASLAIEAVAWARALPALSQVLPAAPWCQLLEQLGEIAAEAAKVDLSSDPLTNQVLTGELPLTLAYLLPELANCKRMFADARQSLTQGIVELLDGQGLMHARNLELLRPLLACWTRCGYLGKTMRTYCFASQAKTQYEWLVLQTLRLSRHDGSQMLSNDAAGEWSSPLLTAALALGGDAEDREIAASILPGRKSSQASSAKLPSPAVHSEWAMTGVLRRDWTRSSDQLSVMYDDKQLLVELNTSNGTIFSGPCNPAVQFNGEELAVQDDWEEVCWQTDADLDYLELETKLGHGLKVQRQMLLARKDRFLFIADAVFGDDSGDINYRHVLPLCDGISFRPESDTHEGILVGRKRLGAVLPLQLPEWRAEREAGSLQQVGDGLELQQSFHGQRLLAPLLIDLDPRRIGKPTTWRRLTISQRLETVRADVAAGYRVQIGRQQWLIYRSLAPVANRSLLGQNFVSEFVVARFTESGEAEELIEIE